MSATDQTGHSEGTVKGDRLFNWRTDSEKRRELIQTHLAAAITTLENMQVDCTRPLRVDEASEIEGRRVTALGYLAEACNLLDAPDIHDPHGMTSRG